MQLPVIVQDYELLQEVGAGAFAIVYKARHVKTKQLFAVKKMKEMQKNHVELVKNQIDLMKRLKHRNIIRYETDFRDKGKWYIVLEYCGKGDLEHFKKKVGKIPEAYCKIFIHSIVLALSELHKNKIVHRDLKLANILINDDNDLKLADFGFSKDNEDGLMQSFCGTPLSMSPEILKRERYDEKCDTWSLGVIMFILLFDRPPYYPGKDHGNGIVGITNAVTKTKHKFDEKTPITDECKDFINQCLEKDPVKRASIDSLQKHVLFTKGVISHLRKQYISGSLNEESEATQRIKQLVGGAFEDHLKKIIQLSSLSEKTLNSLLQGIKHYYSSNQNIRRLFLMMAAKKTDELCGKVCQFQLQKCEFKIGLRKLKKFNNHIDYIKMLISEELGLLKKADDKEPEDLNIEKEMTKFILDETNLILEEAENYSEKRSLFMQLCQFYTKELDKCQLKIAWGMNTDLEYLNKPIVSFVESLNDEKMIGEINEDASSEEDLESFWLIQHQIETKNRKGQEIELGCLFEYILNVNDQPFA